MAYIGIACSRNLFPCGSLLSSARLSDEPLAALAAGYQGNVVNVHTMQYEHLQAKVASTIESDASPTASEGFLLLGLRVRSSHIGRVAHCIFSF
jgi:hypothetical protein